MSVLWITLVKQRRDWLCVCVGVCVIVKKVVWSIHCVLLYY